MLLFRTAANPTERRIANTERPFLVAEFGLNHNRDLELAMRMVDAAAACGVDAIKLQSYTTKYFINRQFANVHALYDIFAGLELDGEFHRRLRDYTVKRGMTFFSTPLTEDWVTTLDRLEVPAFKIASGDINNFGLIRAAAQTGKPLFISTGAAAEHEIKRTLDELQKLGNQYCLLHCVSLYPTPTEKANIGRIARLAQLLPEPDKACLGFSDHTEDCDAAFAAIAVGASVIEKHFTLDKSLPGPDQKMSFDPDEMRALRERLDLAWKIRGNAPNADCHAEETANDYYGKRSLYEFEGRTIAMRPRHPDYPLL